MTRRHWLLLALPLLASLVAGLLHHADHHAWYERIPGFFVVFGFLGCVLLVIFSNIVEDISGFVRPAPLNIDPWIDQGQSSQKPLCSIGNDHLKPLSIKSPLIQITQKPRPGHLRLSLSNRKIDNLLSALNRNPKGHQDHPLDRTCPGSALQNHPIQNQFLKPLNLAALKPDVANLH